MTKNIRLALAILPLALIIGCTDKQKAPAESAVKSAEAAVEALKSEEVTQFAAGPAKAVTDTLADAKAKLAAKDYDSAIKEAQAIPARVKDVVGQAAAAAQAAVESKKQAMSAAWQEASKETAAALEAVHSRIDAIKKQKKLPKGIDKKGLAVASSKAAELETEWSKATEKFKAGAVEEATSLAKSLAGRGNELASTLPNVKAPPDPKAKPKK
jgi:PBP1b-binding outer membrane lipoprotein LpoB